MSRRDGLDRKREGKLPNDPCEVEQGTKPWGAALFGLIGFGAAATVYSWKAGRLGRLLQRVDQFCGISQQWKAGRLGRLLQRVDQFCGISQQINRTQSSWKGGASRLFQKGFREEGWRKYDEEMEKVIGQLRKSADYFLDISQQFNRTQSSFKWGASYSFRKASQEEAWRKHQKRMREEYEDEMERVERIRRMQSVFNRERNKNKRSYESWTESGPGAYHQHSQREDWYWKADSSFRDKRTNHRETPRTNPNYTLSHHYAVLGLNRTPTKPYTEAEVKSAFRAKAIQFHPDQNQGSEEAAEAKFKEILISYEAIKSERKSMP